MTSPISTAAGDAIEAAGGPYAWVGRVAREWGIFAGMTAFFIWQSSVREGALNKRNADQTDFIQKTLVQLIENNTSALQSFKSTLERKQP